MWTKLETKKVIWNNYEQTNKIGHETLARVIIKNKRVKLLFEVSYVILVDKTILSKETY